MAGRSLWAALGVATVVLGIGTAAWAAAPVGSPDVSAMALAPTDVPGARVVLESDAGAEPPFTDSYIRMLGFSHPYGQSQFTLVANSILLAGTPDAAASEYAKAAHQLSRPAARAAILKQYAKLAAKGTKVSVAFAGPRAMAVGDSGMELGFVVSVGKSHLDFSTSIFRVDRVIVEDVAAGSGAIIDPNDALSLGKLIAARVDAQLVPIAVTPPAIAGDPHAGGTLTATPAAWNDSTTTGVYQWQHCDAAGANCVDVPGATAQSYTVGAGDVGFTLRVVETGTNRFGSTASPSSDVAIFS